MRSLDPVAIYERSKSRSTTRLKQRYWHVDLADRAQIDWLLHNMDRDHYLFRDKYIFFTTEAHTMQFIYQFPKSYFTLGSPQR